MVVMDLRGAGQRGSATGTQGAAATRWQPTHLSGMDVRPLALDLWSRRPREMATVSLEACILRGAG